MSCLFTLVLSKAWYIFHSSLHKKGPFSYVYGYHLSLLWDSESGNKKILQRILLKHSSQQWGITKQLLLYYLLVHTCTILNKYAYSVSKAYAHVYSKIFKTNNLLMKLTLYCQQSNNCSSLFFSFDLWFLFSWSHQDVMHL